MKQEPEFVLSRSLRAIDAARRRTFATFAVFWVATFGALLWFGHVLGASDDPKRALKAAVVALVFANFLAASSVILYVSRMARRILRA